MQRCNQAQFLSGTDTKKRIITGKACCVYVCVSLFVTLLFYLTLCLNSVAHHTSPVCHICSVRGIISGEVLSYTYYLTCMGRGIVIATEVVTSKGKWKKWESQAPKGNHHTSCGCAALCSAFWSIEAGSREIGSFACSED